MKKILILIALIYFGVTASAQNAASSYPVPSGSLNVEYFNDRSHDSSKQGRLKITNNSDLTITKAHIRVTVVISWYEQSSYPIRSKKTLELCDDDFTNIPAARRSIELTSSRRGVIEGGPEKEGKTYQYNIEITNVAYDPVPFPEPQKR
ncbi:MAG: hypothetical protein II829_01370 [Bacteroidales bacterium]|nr:hypothetical protein [Bacteroidales bacterium]